MVRMGDTARVSRAFDLATTATDAGIMWRAEVTDCGRLVDATRWTTGPRKAHADGDALVHGRYWTDDGQPSWSTAA